jgi:anti-anti-sigma factor
MTETGPITTSMVGTDAWVVPHGDLDIANIAEFESTLAHAARCSQRYVFVEVANVTFIDAGVIGAIVRADTALARQGRRLKLIGAPCRVQYVLDLTGLGERFGVEADLLDHPQTAEHKGPSARPYTM